MIIYTIKYLLRNIQIIKENSCENIYSRIFPNNSLRYELSKDEKYNKGIHLKLKIGIFNNLKNRVSELQDFNFFIC